MTTWNMKMGQALEYMGEIMLCSSLLLTKLEYFELFVLACCQCKSSCILYLWPYISGPREITEEIYELWFQLQFPHLSIGTCHADLERLFKFWILECFSSVNKTFMVENVTFYNPDDDACRVHVAHSITPSFGSFLKLKKMVHGGSQSSIYIN